MGHMRPQSEETKQRTRTTRPIDIAADFLWGDAEGVDLGVSGLVAVLLAEDHCLSVMVAGKDEKATFFLVPEYVEMFRDLLAQRFLLQGIPVGEGGEPLERAAMILPEKTRELGRVNQFGMGRMDFDLYVRSTDLPIAVAARLLPGDAYALWQEVRKLAEEIPEGVRRVKMKSLYTRGDRDAALRAMLDPSKKRAPVETDDSMDKYLLPQGEEP